MLQGPISPLLVHLMVLFSSNPQLQYTSSSHSFAGAYDESYRLDKSIYYILVFSADPSVLGLFPIYNVIKLGGICSGLEKLVKLEFEASS